MTADPPITPAQQFTVTNGELGPILWCPACDRQMAYVSSDGFLYDPNPVRVSLAVLLADARRHLGECRDR